MHRGPRGGPRWGDLTDPGPSPEARRRAMYVVGKHHKHDPARSGVGHHRGEPAMRVSRIAKTIVAALSAAIGVAYAAVSDDVYSSTEAVNTVLAVLTVFGVWAVPNAPKQD